MSWRFLNATSTGTSHERTGMPCQDDCFVDVVEGVLVAIVSDGAGSASSSEEGAGLVCEKLFGEVERWLRGGGRVETLVREDGERWIAAVRSAIEERAAAKELAPRDFACTLAAALAAADTAAFLQIGDGAIVARNPDALDVVFWPDGGEYANMTYFVTDADWTKHLHFEVRHAVYDDVAVMSDGLQRLALRFDTRSAHAPFFEPMLHALAAAAPGFASDLETALVAFLCSAAVNARTDDDKSLVLATRRSGSSHASG